MKLLADKNWNVALCGGMTVLGHGGTVLLLPYLAITPKTFDAGGTRISIGWLLWCLWLDLAWMKWGRTRGGTKGGR